MTDQANAISLRAMTTSYLDRGEGRIAYDVQGTGPLVVCLHGMGDLRSVYRFTVPALVEAGYRVATMDLRGHGDSDDTFSAFDDVAAAYGRARPDRAPRRRRGRGCGGQLDGRRRGRVGRRGTPGPGGRHRPDRDRSSVTQPATPLHVADVPRCCSPSRGDRPCGARYYRRYYPGRPPADLGRALERIRTSMRRGRHWRSFVRTTRTDHTPARDRLEPGQAHRPWSSWAPRTATGRTRPPRRGSSPSRWAASCCWCQTPGTTRWRSTPSWSTRPLRRLRPAGSLRVRCLGWGSRRRSWWRRRPGWPMRWGCDRLTLATLAQRLGVALPSLYKHVRGLDALLQKLSALATAELAAELVAAAAGRSRGDAVRATADAYRAYARRAPGPLPGRPTGARPRRSGARRRRRAGCRDRVRGAAWVRARRRRRWSTRPARCAARCTASCCSSTAGGFGLPVDVDRSFHQLVAALEVRPAQLAHVAEAAERTGRVRRPAAPIPR